MSNKDSNITKGGYQFGQNHILESLWHQFNNTSSGQWIMKPEELILLHDKLKLYQPKQILELGTGIGCSTALMAFTCLEAHIYTVENNQKCIDLAKKLIPEKFQERIYFRKAEVGVIKPQFKINPLVYWSGFGEFDWKHYDFVLIDGPGPFLTQIKEKETGEIWETLAELPNGDIIFFLPLMKEDTIVYVDKRKINVLLYDRHFSHYLDKIDSGPKHTIYKRTAKKLSKDLSDFENSDLAFNELKKHGYFD